MPRIEKALALLNAGFTSKSDQKRCLELLSRTFEDLRNNISRTILFLKSENKLSEALANELYWLMPYELHNFRPKHAEALRFLFPEEIKEIEYLFELRTKIKDAPVVKPVSGKAKIEEIKKAIVGKSTVSPIETVVLPLKTAAIERAEQEANNLVKRCKEKLKEAGYDLGIVAPYPESNNCSPQAYQIAMSKRRTFELLVKHVSGSRRANDPEIVEIDYNAVKRFIKNTKEDAASQYDAFVVKLIIKIGEVTTAKLEGDHVWSYSILTVTKADGTTENWKTQMIVNVSKLGKLFNQWPTRKVK
jgi:hypothetical protein